MRARAGRSPRPRASSNPVGLGRVAADRGEDAPRGARRAAIAAALVSASRPTLSIRSTPASRAAATSSASGRSQRKRWVWESITARLSLSSSDSLPPMADFGRLLPRDLRARPGRRDAGDPGLGRRAGAAGRGGDGPSARPTTSSPAPAARTRCAPTARPSAAGGSCRGCCATSPSATSRPRCSARRCRRRCCWRRSACRRSSTRTASWRPPAPRRRVGLPMIASTASALHAGGDRRGGRRRRRAGSSSTGPTTASSPRASSSRAEARRLRRDRPHRRHLHPRLEAARPAAGLAALPRRHRRRQLLPGPGLPRRPREDARGGPRRGDRPLPRRPRQPLADLGRPRLAARA